MKTCPHCHIRLAAHSTIHRTPLNAGTDRYPMWYRLRSKTRCFTARRLLSASGGRTLRRWITS